jgi:hypothetical protein
MVLKVKCKENHCGTERGGLSGVLFSGMSAPGSRAGGFDLSQDFWKILFLAYFPF